MPGNRLGFRGKEQGWIQRIALAAARIDLEIPKCCVGSLARVLMQAHAPKPSSQHSTFAKKYGHREMLKLCISRRAKVCRTLGSRVHFSGGNLMETTEG